MTVSLVVAPAPAPVPAAAVKLDDKFVVLPYALGYGSALRHFRNACKNDSHSIQPVVDGKPRPFTLEETVAVRVEDYDTLHDAHGKIKTPKERRRLFDVSLDTCSHVFYGREKLEFTAISPNLLHLSPYFDREQFSPTNDQAIYRMLLDAAVLKNGERVFNRQLSKSKFLVHPLWGYLVPNTPLRRRYAEIVYDECGIKQGCGFYIDLTPQQLDRGVSLFLNSLASHSVAGAHRTLNGATNFLRMRSVSDQK